MTLLQKLTQWQKDQAQKEGLEGYMVVSFTALKEIAASLPKTEDELLAVKGIGPAKIRKYGRDILALCNGQTAAISTPQHKEFSGYGLFDEAAAVNAMLDAKAHDEDIGEEALTPQSYTDEAVRETDSRTEVDVTTGELHVSTKDTAIGVGDFLAQLNHVLGSYFSHVRIRGEVIGFKRNQNGHAYFELKDAFGIMRVSVFKNAYDMSNVILADGMEIIIVGKPSHHAQYGFSFIGESVELAGEGALKKAYEALKTKLLAEGLMDGDKKRSVPSLPSRIGLITSPTGAAIGDFTTNIGKYGYNIYFHASSVEGAKAVKELLRAINVLATKNLDVLVITRGGGSLESLQAFNNEHVVRALAEFPAPVIAGIGHEQDETLSTLVADVGVSTPTAAARAVRASWDDAVGQLGRYEQTIVHSFDRVLMLAWQKVDDAEGRAIRFFESIVTRCEHAFSKFSVGVQSITTTLLRTREKVVFYEKSLTQYNPERQLALGYSITKTTQGKILRSVGDVEKGDTLTTRLADGDLHSRVQ